MAERALIELEHIGKRYGGVPALADVSVTIRAGTVHALVGENGAGKSTLGKIISGTVVPDDGTIRLDGREVSFATPRDAIRGG
ncbi:MAG: ATP-binding cassette domain-containing protein, partial [Rhizobiaceae bacterium]|nr:ATP-binding cassette domain-containing protein [Rhizobiaceae bacterium]